MENKTIRIKASVNGGDTYIKAALTQDFDFLEVLSLKLSQEEVYTRFSSDYGVIAGRCIVNSGLGVPNCKLSIFIKINGDDVDNEYIATLHPYKNLQDLNVDGLRYNLLANNLTSDRYSSVGSFPTKNAILDNDQLFEVYDKYYKYTTTTNDSGDFMFFGIPVGTHMLTMDADLSDIGIYSQRPYDFIEQGSNKNLFESTTKFKESKNLDTLSQIKSKQLGVTVMPFWGDTEINEIGITRVDIDLGHEIIPSAIFMGSIFGDNEKNSLNKNCAPRKDLGRLCETITTEGSIAMIRETPDGRIERFDVEGGRVIDENGAWAYRIPMNLDYVITNEYGELTPTDDTTKGIPTRAKVRFKISMDDSGDSGRLRSRASYLIPHNPKDISEEDYSFDSSTSDKHFRDLYWNKIYTIKNHITRVQGACGGNCSDNRHMVGIKDVDNCVGLKNPFPFNKLDGDFNPIFSILCIIIGIIILVIKIVNEFLSWLNGIGIGGVIDWYPFKGIKCVKINCGSQIYTPGCGGKAVPSDSNGSSSDVTHECFKTQLAESLNVYEFDFYNDWVNGSLFSFLIKYKKKKNEKGKFCDLDASNKMYIVDTIINGSNNIKDFTNVNIGSGIIKEYNGELFYGAYHNKGYLLFATDLYNLGSVFDCDWQGIPNINKYLTPSSYQLPPKIDEEFGVTEFANDGSPNGLLFNLTCTKLTINSKQGQNIKRLCEIGVGLEEYGTNNALRDEYINNSEIENQYIRDVLLYLNDPTLTGFTNTGLSSGFGNLSSYSNLNPNLGLDYVRYREFASKAVHQSLGNSFYFYFGSTPGSTALDKMNSKYFAKNFGSGVDTFTISGSVTNVSNIGGSNGAINNIIIDGGTAPFTYEWNTGIIANNLINLSVGQYILTVSDFNKNVVRKIFNVLGPQPIIVDTSKIDEQSINGGDGIIYIDNIIGGTSPYDITLTGPNGSTTVNNVLNHMFNGLNDGSYQISVIDSGLPSMSYSTSDPIVINKPKELLVSLTNRTNPTCFGNSNGFINIDVTSGNFPYSFLTTSTGFSKTDMNLNNLSSGTYYVTVTDSIGQVFNDVITLTQPDEPIMARTTLSGGVNVFLVSQPNTADEIYTFYKNNSVAGTAFKMNTAGLGESISFEYGALIIGDKLKFKTPDGCFSSIITYNG